MPERETIERAKQAKREGKSPTTQAGEFVKEEIRHIREGKHGARSTKQAIAIGLSKARRAGVKLGAPPPDTPQATRANARRASPTRGKRRSSAKRSQAAAAALRREGRAAASRSALSRQASQAARRRGPNARRKAARKAATTRQRQLA